MASLMGTLLQGASSALGVLAETFAKAEPDESTNRAPGGSKPDTAGNAPPPTQPANEPPKTLFWDPFAVIEQLGYKDRPSPLTYNTLKQIVWRMPILSDIIMTRVNQVASFAQPRSNRYDIGFRIKMRDGQEHPDAADKKLIQAMQTYFMRTGITKNPRGRSDFESYLRALTWDALRFDQDCTEIVPNRKGQPAEFYAVDASSMRLAASARQHIDEDLDDEIRYVQVYDNMVITQYTQEELCFGIRNPITDMRNFGYGTSELEMLMNAITSLLYAWEYNSRFFSQGTAPKGLLNFKGTVPEKHLAQFKRQWYSMLSGVENAWKTPITNSPDDIQWLSMQSSNRDMEFNAWMDFLIKVVCAAYSMDPSEINFKYGNTGQTSGLSEDSNRDKVVESRERGLRPILRHISGNINKFIMWPINENFEFEFVGLDAMNRNEVADLNGKLVRTYRTIDELRAEDDLPPLPDKQGEIILDATFLQNMMAIKQDAQAAEQAAQQQAQMEAQMAQGGGGFGGPPPPGGEQPPGGPGGSPENPPQGEQPPEAGPKSVDEEQGGEAAFKSLNIRKPFRVDLNL